MLIERVEDNVVALAFLREAGIAKRRRDGEEQRQEKEKDNPHGEPPVSATASGFSLLPAWKSA